MDHYLRDWAHVGCSALRATHRILPIGSTAVPWVLTGTYQSASSLWIVDCGVGAVVKWSCGVIERCGEYECISTPLHWRPRLADLVDSLRFALQVSLSVLQHNVCILHVLGIQS